ncbi:uncharacterized protein LOC119364370 [Triticum dicoccoides]|uniref:uncharacterized protein LOC119364370 n=1 Tax=Triticum dicoccoides TaxID=85692 RepID=UPI00188F2D94|nr:uncharacterized protein LOC119364370 [Triticum dicoccoides]
MNSIRTGMSPPVIPRAHRGHFRHFTRLKESPIAIRERPWRASIGSFPSPSRPLSFISLPSHETLAAAPGSRLTPPRPPPPLDAFLRRCRRPFPRPLLASPPSLLLSRHTPAPPPTASNRAVGGQIRRNSDEQQRREDEEHDGGRWRGAAAAGLGRRRRASSSSRGRTRSTMVAVAGSGVWRRQGRAGAARRAGHVRRGAGCSSRGSSSSSLASSAPSSPPDPQGEENLERPLPRERLMEAVCSSPACCFLDH